LIIGGTDKLRLSASLPVPDSKPTLPKRTSSSAQPAVTADNGRQDDHTNYSEEWVEARKTADKFDATLFDLRKYGFSILTGLITAGSFLGFEKATQFIQIGVIIVTMVLVVILYWLDIYYQSLLYGAVLRTRFLEIFRLNRGLSIYISAMYGASNLGRGLHFLYGGFLVGVFLLGFFVANIAPVRTDDKISVDASASIILSFIVGISFLFALGSMLAIFLMCDLRRTRSVKRISCIFKHYYNDRGRPCTARRVEECLNIMFDRYL
jgi:hypothetical protein